jgi:Kyakuja-Dileera-Zisupton transposase
LKSLRYRQMNMDYGLSGSIASTNAASIGRLNLLYDINCQYSRRLEERFDKGRGHITLPDNLEIVYAIGKFHVHGHQEKCYARYSPMFVRGIGWTSGEILESLWSVLNEAARATQTMTKANRSETLDALINDSNWKKMLNLSKDRSIVASEVLTNGNVTT